MLPTAAILPDTICVLGAGSYIDIDVLLNEIETSGISSERLVIDPNAYIVTDEHKRAEAEWGLGKNIGSTLSGTGAAVIERTRRITAAHLAQNEDRLTRFVKPVRPLLRSRLQRGEQVILEGTQGLGLSVLHSPYYPKATSRDTTAASFVSEAGLSPFDVDDIVMVIRAFPIRVAGDSGPLPNEIDWETITREGGWETKLVEHTSVTKKIRRVGRFDAPIVREAIEINRPTQIVLNHVDYFDAQSHNMKNFTYKIIDAISNIEAEIGSNINLIGLCPLSLILRHKILAKRLTA